MADRKSQFASDLTIPSTVPAFLFDAMTKATSRDFAQSYLFGAEIVGRRLTPRTRIAWERLSRNPDAVDVLESLDLSLAKPELFGSPRGSTIQLDRDGRVIGDSASSRQRSVSR